MTEEVFAILSAVRNVEKEIVVRWFRSDLTRLAISNIAECFCLL